ncbi:N-acetyltransferase family protein [Bacillus sp. AGMB 02131]|uniref:N-acetyltransferase family protein n=1 Tax=Peribacillus faecalis TaxID=2772559 RepID=A0A927D050_9BACI|nr:GNAT family N-acetyltransferase [Peribacillus faecalis]MBD3109005.1 N-acetyltransferase family protein [Peribacillus faecalis]
MKEIFKIRDAIIEDLPEIVQIYNSTIPSRMVTADLQEVTVESRMNWFQEHSPNCRPLWVILNDGNICAWLSFQSFYGRPAYNGTAEVSIYIHEQFRNKGLGKYMLEQAIEFCPKIGITNLLGFIFAHNHSSIKLFERHGFDQWGHLPKVAVLDGIERDLMIFGKRIHAEETTSAK